MENAQQEPSMEEILASIRRIISEDEEEAEGGAPAASSTPASVASKPSGGASEETKPALVQNNEVEPDKSDTENQDDADTRLETEDVEMIKKNVATAVEEDASGALLDQATESAAANAFQTLSQSVRVADGDGRTLESIVIQMIEPMIKEWLDGNLPQIVEEKVEDEVQRLARRRT